MELLRRENGLQRQEKKIGQRGDSSSSTLVKIVQRVNSSSNTLVESTLVKIQRGNSSSITLVKIGQRGDRIHQSGG